MIKYIVFSFDYIRLVARDEAFLFDLKNPLLFGKLHMYNNQERILSEALLIHTNSLEKYSLF